MPKVNKPPKPGFTRVLIPARNKTIQILNRHAANPNYMNRHGLVRLPEPALPPVVEEVQAEPVPTPRRTTKPNTTA